MLKEKTMKDIASKYTEELRQLNFPNKPDFKIITVTKPNAEVVVDFKPNNSEDYERACRILECSRLNLHKMQDFVIAKGLKWQEATSADYTPLFKEYTKKEAEIWDNFEHELIEAYLPGVNHEIQDEFWTRCWKYAKARDEGMGGIEELFDTFSLYLTKEE